MKKIIALSIVILCGCITPSNVSDGWFQERPGDFHVPFQVVEMDVLPCADPYGYITLGCYFPFSGVAYIRKRLNPWLRQCVIEHEYKHYLGKNHGKNYNDC